jgi:putative ABC transport system permease protein
LTNSFVRQVSVNVGFEPRDLALATIRPSKDRYPTPASARGFFDDALHRTERVPGVVAVTAGDFVPPQSGIFYDVDDDAVEDAAPTSAMIATVEPNFFQVLRVPLIAGRSFGPDDARSGAIVVNEPLARHYWPDKSAVGKRLRLQASDWRLVIGVVGDVKSGSFTGGSDRLKAYLPFPDRPTYGTIAARTTGDPTAAAARIRRSLEAMDPLAVRDVSTAEDAYGTLIAGPRLLLGLMSAFTAGALLLALIGVYGLVSVFVTARKRELGIRVALGANVADVRRLVVREALRPAIVGVAFGLAGGLAATTMLRRVLFEVSPHDPLTAALVSMVLLIAVVLVAWGPARHAAAVDPIESLRIE